MKKIIRLLLVLLAFTPTASLASDLPNKTARAIFAGGCFWCMQPPFDKTEGVIKTTVGYTGGKLKNPTYEQVSHEETGHYEAIEVIYDPKKISYDKIVDIFWKNVDPLDDKGQFCDKGNSYLSAIFYLDDVQKNFAQTSLKKVKERFKSDIATKVLPAATFWPAEEYHQSYYKKNPIRYAYYRRACGRDSRLKELWE